MPAFRAEGAKNRKAVVQNRNVSSPQATQSPVGSSYYELLMRSLTLLGPGGLSKARTPTPSQLMRGSGLRPVLLYRLSTWLPLSGPQFVYL